MKRDKGAILASMAIIMLASVLAGAGTTAWFSAGPVTTGQYTMNTATMTMALVETEPIIFDNLKPGEEFGPIYIKIQNTGTMDIPYLAISWELNNGNPVSPGSNAWKLADKIIVTGMREFIPGYGWQDDLSQAGGQEFHTLVQDGDMEFTLLEMAQSYSISRGEPHSGPHTDWPIKDQFGMYKKYASDGVTGESYDIAPGPAIIKDGTYIMELTFKFSEEAENDLQGKTVRLSVTFFGMQNWEDQRP